MPTVITGTVSTGGSTGGDLSDRFVTQISDQIFKLGPDILPLTHISRMAQKKFVGNQTFKVLEDEPMPRTDAVNNGAGYASGATSVVVDNGTYFRPKDIVVATRTGEKLFVSSISTNTLTVVRGYGTTSAAALVDNDELIIMGNALDEASNAPAARVTKVASRTNYLQFFSRTTDVTEIRSNSEDYGQDEEQRQIAHCRYEIMRDIEYAFLFGEPLSEVEGSAPKDSAISHTRYTTGGLKYWIDNSASSNVLDAAGVLTQNEFYDWAAPLFKNSPVDTSSGQKQIMLFCSSKAYNVFNQFALSPIQTKVGDNKFGINLAEYFTPYGRFMLHHHYLLDGDEYGDYCFAVNPDYIGYRCLNNMDLTVKEDIQDPNSHKAQHEFYSVCGFYITLPKVHGYIKNISLAG